MIKSIGEIHGIVKCLASEVAHSFCGWLGDRTGPFFLVLRGGRAGELLQIFPGWNLFGVDMAVTNGY